MNPEQGKEFIRFNKILGKEASIGPIPANQLIPWIAIAAVCYTITNGFFSLGLQWFFVTTLWLTITWWLLTGNKPYKFIDQFKTPGGKDWCNGNKIYISPLPSQRPRWIRQRYADSVVRVRLKPKVVPNQYKGKSLFMPFQNDVNICCVAEIIKDNRQISACLLEQGKDQYQVVFMFKLEGLHDVLTRNEVSSFADQLTEGFKGIPPGERITFCMGSYSDDLERQQQLENLADNCQLAPIAVLLRNEQKRVRELTQTGTRQVWQQYVFCTWTASNTADSANSDWWSKIESKLKVSLLGSITGNTRVYQEQFFEKLFIKAFQEGFIPWETLLTTKIGLNVTPCSKREIWQWLWNRFNQGKAPAIPQVITLEETSDNSYKLYETKTTEKHIVTVLIEGHNGESACPEHRESRDTVFIRGRGVNKQCGVVVMEEPPAGWASVKEQLRWMWKCMSAGFVRDTEAWVEISLANNFLIQDNLARQAKQTKVAKTRALIKGSGRDVGAEIKQEESFDAQRRLYEGMKSTLR